MLSLAQRCGGCGTERSSEFGSVNPSRCRHARARGATIPGSSEADRPARAAWSALRLLVASSSSFWRNCWLADSGSGPTMELRRSMLTSASPARSGGAGAGADRAKARYGVMTTDRKICSTYRGGACSRSRSAAAAAALNDHRNLAALTRLAAVTRARGAPIPGSPEAERPARAAWWALRLLVDVGISFSLYRGLLFADSCSGPTMELRRSS